MPNTGDELQRSKKGILELTDLIVITKADGNLKEVAKNNQLMLKNLPLSELKSQENHRTIPVMLCSMYQASSHAEIWSEIQRQLELLKSSSAFNSKRKRQRSQWFDAYSISANIKQVKQKVTRTCWRA